MALESKKKEKRTPSVLAERLVSRIRPTVICVSNAWGGLEQTAARDALELAKLGFHPKFVLTSESPLHEYLATKDDIELVPLSFRPRDHFDLKFRSQLLKLAFDEQSNLFHAHQTTLLGSIVPWFWNKPDRILIASRHIMNSHNKRNPYHSSLYRRMDAIVVMSETLKKNILDTHSLKERQMKVVRLGIDFDKFNPSKVDPGRVREEWGVDASTVVIGLVGRIDPAKGQETLLKALAGLSIPGERSKKIKCVFVGEQTRGGSANHLERLKKMVNQFRMNDQVIFTGFKENVPEMMAAFDFFVMPSRQEAFGLVAIEAMAMGCPVIISNGGSASEIVGNQEYGLLCRPDDPYDLRIKIQELISSPKARERMGKKGREYVRKNYDSKDRILNTLELYERCFRRRGLFRD